MVSFSFVHRSRMKESLVSMPAICSEVLTYFVWMTGTRSNNQSKFVLEMCLMDWVQPFLIILIIVIFDDKQKCPLAGDVCVWKNTVNTICKRVFLGLVLRVGFLPAGGSNISVSMSHKLNAAILSNLRPASNEIDYLCFSAGVQNNTLLFTRPACRHKCVASRCTTYLRSPVGVLEKTNQVCTPMQCFQRESIFCNHS